MPQASRGNFFEDFEVGQVIRHATPRTITTGDAALYTGLFGSRFAVQSADTFARAVGYRAAPIDDLLVFHIVFGKTAPDISLNAVANLGYADGRFLRAVYPGDTINVTSEVIGVKENSNAKTGIVYVRTTGRNQDGDDVLSYVRWVMVRKRDASSPAPESVVPKLPDVVATEGLGGALPPLDCAAWDDHLSGSVHRWDAYSVGEVIDHVDGMTIEEAEHQIATRAFQNTARVHFDQQAAAGNRFGRRLIYGGYIISLARALSFNGLENAFHIAAINAGRHSAPCFAGDTIYAASQIVDKQPLASRDDAGAIRIRMLATKNRPATQESGGLVGESHTESVVLEFDFWCLLPR